MEAKKTKYDYIVTPYQEKIPSILKIPCNLFWTIFSIIIITFDLFFLFKYEEAKEIVIPHVIMGILPGLIAISTIWFSKILENFTPALFMFINWTEDKILEWYSTEIRTIFNFRNMVISGLIMTASMIPISILGPLMPKNIEPSISFLVIMVFLNFLAGSLIYVMIRICCMVNKLGEIESIKISIYQHPLTSVKAVGKLMGQISLVTILIYFIGVSYHIFTRTDNIMISITLFFGFFVFFFFIFPQAKIHKIMYRVKHKKLRNFSLYLEEALEKVTVDPSQDNLQRVKELFGIQQSLSQMGEWPFDTKLLFPILTGIAVPIIAALLQLILK